KSYMLFIVHQQDLYLFHDLSPLLGYAALGGEIDDKNGPLSRFILHFNVAPVMHDDLVGNGETQSYSLFFGREERIKDILQKSRAYAPTTIPNRYGKEWFFFRGRLLRANRDGPFPTHGLKGVHKDVDKDLFHLLYVA